MQVSDLVGTLLGEIPSELVAEISRFGSLLEAVITAPTTSEEIRWLLVAHQKLTISYFEASSCEIHAWKQSAGGVFHVAATRNYEDQIRIPRASRHDIDTVIEWIMKRKSCFSPDPMMDEGILDLKSYFLLLGKRCEELEIPPSISRVQTRRLALHSLHHIIQRFEYYPIGLKLHLRTSIKAFEMNTGMLLVCTSDDDTEPLTKCKEYRAVLERILEALNENANIEL